MKAIGFEKHLPISDEESLLDLEVPSPKATGRDLLVAVRAIAVNPVDTKVRGADGEVENPPRILGWDVAGVVEAAGPDVDLFTPGDEVFYAGDITRPGCNSELHLVDERIVGRKPSSLSFPEAAALPLTSITAWEALFERLGVSKEGEDAGKRILIIGGAGGVGSIATQLAKQVAGLEIVATASREESTAWCLDLGADHVVDHSGDIPEQVRGLGIDGVEFVLCLHSTDQHWRAMAEIVAPQGHICSIVGTERPVDLRLLMQKSVSFAWELMFTRPMFDTADMIEQHRLLDEVAALVDAGTIRTTLGEVMRPISAASLREAHAQLEGGHTVGKVVLEGWS